MLEFFLKSLLFGRRFGWIKQIDFGLEGIFRVRSKKSFFYIARAQRLNRYLYGVPERIAKVVASYGPQLTDLSGELNIIDVGCNDGVFLAYFKRENGKHIGLDIEPLELLCARLNAPQAHLFNVAAGESLGYSRFESSPESSSSTLIQTKAFSEQHWIPTTTIDSIVNSFFEVNEIIDILKVDAEGGEPEVLRGTRESLHRIRFIAVDVGPERGPNCEWTNEAVHKILTDSGFKNVWISSSASRVLYQNFNVK